MLRVILTAGLCIAPLFASAALAQSAPPYTPPPEVAAFMPGSGADVARANCAACHSADYIETQPRGAGFGKEFWQAEVTKMIKVFGARISEPDARVIVDYLAATYR
jgi:sulfite dehydrogenase (cytochrome) subunit B